jgi:F0F1-type ATP synthase assembly protein I
MGNAEGRPSNRQDSQAPFIRRAAIYLGVATELAGTIIGGPLVGYVLDKYFVTSPWFLIAMTVIAFIGGFIRLLQWGKFFARERNGSGVEKDNTAH